MQSIVVCVRFYNEDATNRLGDPASGFEPTGLMRQVWNPDSLVATFLRSGSSLLESIGLMRQALNQPSARARSFGDAEGFPLATPENIFSINSEAIARP